MGCKERIIEDEREITYLYICIGIFLGSGVTFVFYSSDIFSFWGNYNGYNRHLINEQEI